MYTACVAQSRIEGRNGSGDGIGEGYQIKGRDESVEQQVFGAKHRRGQEVICRDIADIATNDNTITSIIITYYFNNNKHHINWARPNVVVVRFELGDLGVGVVVESANKKII